MLINKFHKKKKYNDYINIGNIEKNSLNELIRIIKKYYSQNFKEKFLKRNKADVFKTKSSILKLKQNINYFPKTKLEFGMKRFIKWFKEFD